MVDLVGGTIQVDARFPPKLEMLFRPRRYKVAFGGRGSGKSWAYARALLIQSVQTPLRILCAREVQKSIKQSVKQLLEDQIEALGLSKQFLVQETEIRGANGTQIYFAGLGNQTADSIKSFEGVDRVWVEEAQTVSKRSWDILIPTIRKPASEIWITFNPELDTDETYQRFVATPPPESAVVEINYADNPWFPEVLEQERLHCQITDPDGYRTIWEGQCRSAVHGAIYAGEVDAAIREQRICNVPYDPMLRAHAIWDLGWNDAMTIIVAQRLRSEIRIIDYIEDSHKTLDWYVAELKERHYNWGFDFLPHDADHKDFKTGKSTTQLLKAFGRKPKLTPNLPVEKGIKQARMTFGQCYFDKTKAARLVECLKRYRRRVPESTGEPGAPIHDEFSHGCLVAGTLVTTERGLVPIEQVMVGDRVMTPAGYAVVDAAGPVKVADSLIEITTTDGRTIKATPEHKIFTTRGVLIADALRYDDIIQSEDLSLCVSSEKSSLMGYRAATIETFSEIGSGSGQIARFMSTRKAENKSYCIGKYSRSAMATLRRAIGFIREMAISTIFPKTTGCEALAEGNQNILCLSSTRFAFTESQMAITKRTGMSMAEHSCTDMSGSTSTDQYQNGTTSTIKMGISRTMPLKTWSAWLTQIIQSFMRQITYGLAAKITAGNWCRLEKKPRHGIRVRQAANGIATPQNKHGSIESGLRRFARFAESRFQHLTRPELSTATRIAKLQRYAAGEKVYDLTVRHHHCYFANGLLVSNSDAFRYLSLVADELTNEMDKPIPPARQAWSPFDASVGY